MAKRRESAGAPVSMAMADGAPRSGIGCVIFGAGAAGSEARAPAVENHKLTLLRVLKVRRVAHERAGREDHVDRRAEVTRSSEMTVREI